MTQATPASEWMTVTEAAQVLGVTTAAVYLRTRRRRDPLEKQARAGGIWVRRADIDAWRAVRLANLRHALGATEGEAHDAT